MTDTTLKTIKEKIQDHLEAMTLPGVTAPMLDSVVLEYPLNEPAHYPYALVMFEGGSYDSDINSCLELTVVCNIWLFADKEETIRSLIQQIQKLWMTSTLFTALSLLGVINITPGSSDLPDGQMAVRGNKYSGCISFNLLIRYTY